VVFTTRVQRLLSNTTPQIIYHVTPAFSLEAQSDVQIVRYLRHTFEDADNFNTRSSLTGAYNTGWNDVDALLQVGYFSINYRSNTASPDASGYFFRGGARGEVSPNLHLIALMGVSKASSHDFPGTNVNAELTTADIEFHLAYTVTETVTAFGDYSRRFGFSPGGSPFEVVDSAAIILRYALREDWALKARIQYDKAHPVPGLVRSYESASAGAEFRVIEHILLEGQIAYRMGTAQDGPNGPADFSDFIFSLGIVGVF
jgi:hypothetical protein